MGFFARSDSRAARSGVSIGPLPSVVIFFVTYLGFASTRSLVAIAVLFIFYRLFQGIFRPVGEALASDFVPELPRASAVGSYSAIVGLPELVANFVAGLLWEHVSHAAVFYYGAIFAIADLQSQLLAAGAAGSGPIVHTGIITSMQSGVHVYGVDGIAHSEGVKIEFTSTDPLPASDASVILRIGSNFVLTGNLLDLYHAVFTLTPTEYATTKDGDPVILQKGLSKSPSQIWDFGRLNKSLAQPQK